MTTLDSVEAPQAVLNDREIEILRLLAAGHTVKSIAAQLNRSEASINERLRDARRKTGFGSSRELARDLASQEKWDSFPDLPSAPHSDDRDAAPERIGIARSKGPRLMLITIPIAAAAWLLAANTADRPARLAAPSEAIAPSPLAGRWALDVARIPAEERPKSVTITFAQDGAKWTTDVQIVAPNGTVLQARSTAAPDGTAVPISGTMPFIDTASLRQPAPGTLVMTLGKGGVPVSTRVYTVATNGRTMTETIIWSSSSLPALETTTFNRVG